MNVSNLKRCLFIGVYTVLTALPLDVCAQKQYHVAACDWMMLKRQKLGEFQLAKDIQADGVEMDMGPLGKREMFDNKLRDPHFQELFRRTADSLGIEVPSMAMSGFFAQSFLKRENYKELVQDCLNSMEVMGARVAFLPLGGSGQEWQQSGPVHDEMVRRLHEVGEMALAAGKVIGIRAQMNACANLQLLKEVNSEGIKIYYNLQDAVDQGRNPYKELKQLLFCPYGEIQLILDDGTVREEITLNDPSIGILIEKPTWREMLWLKKDSVLCVAASEHYQVADYIRDYGEFLTFVQHKIV